MAIGHVRHSAPAVPRMAALLAVPLLALAQLLPSAMCQDYNLATLNKDSLARIDNIGVRLDLNLFRLDPKLLDTDALKYFVLLNNCKAVGNIDQRVVKALDNELDYPKVAAFYKSKAAGILADMPTGGTISLGGASLGTYDTTKKVFPILIGRDGRGKLEFSNVRVDPDHSNLSNYCLDAQRQYLSTQGFPNTYGLAFTPPLTFAELPMDEASARTYIEHTNTAQRVITFYIDFRILDTPPQISRINGTFVMAAMTAEIEKITIVKGYSGEKVAVLYDRAGQKQSATTVPSLQKTANSTAGNDHTVAYKGSAYEFRLLQPNFGQVLKDGKLVGSIIPDGQSGERLLGTTQPDAAPDVIAAYKLHKNGGGGGSGASEAAEAAERPCSAPTLNYLDGAVWKPMTQVADLARQRNPSLLEAIKHPLTPTFSGYVDIWRYKGATADLTLEPNPKFCLEILPGYNPSNILLYNVDVKKDHREFQLQKGAEKGIAEKRLRTIAVKRLSDTVIEIMPSKSLEPGQYILSGPLGTYDFGVEDTR